MATIRSGNRSLAINAVARNEEASTEEGTVARCEMDSHADTFVAGPNFRILEFTGEECDVTPYTTDYKPMVNVAVVNAATAFTDVTTGETVILQFNQVLWYGKKMKMSLINPNQLRHFGIMVSDDPTDKTRPFGISMEEDRQIPFLMDGTTVYFETRVPTAWELENCKTIQVTDDTVWNPANVTIATIDTTSDLPLVEVLMRRNLSSLNVSNKSIPEITENDLTPYDDATLLNRMIGNVKVATAHRDAHVAFVGSKDRHSNVNAETVARKFRCGIETAQRTLKTTTQRGVRHSIHPLHTGAIESII